MLDFKGTLSIAAKELIRRHLNDSGSEDDCKNDKPISPVDIDEFLIKKLGLPNPELAVICSPTPCLLGVLPWHMRLTEIVSLPSFGSLMPHDFIQVLNRYTMCQQRLGKWSYFIPNKFWANLLTSHLSTCTDRGIRKFGNTFSDSSLPFYRPNKRTFFTDF